MDRVVAVALFFVIAAGLAAVGIWWVRGTQQAMKRRDPRLLQARAMQFRRAIGVIVVVVLMSAALFGAAWVYGNGGALNR